MALNIEAECYVNEVKQFGWGTVAKMSHSQRGKNDAGEWITTGKDYLDVVLPEGEPAPAENSIVKITGTFKIETFEKRDGSTGINIKVKAKTIEAVNRNPVDAVRNILAPLGASEISSTW